MKKTITLLALCLISFSFLRAQNFPYGINYQAVARDANGNAKQYPSGVPIRFSINKTTAGGTLIWQETQTTLATNSMGQFNAIIGAGATTGAGSAASFSVINWAADVHWLTVDIFNGSVYVPISSQQFQSVPYAFNSNTTTQRYAVNQEVYPAGTAPVYGALTANTWMDIPLSTIATSSNTTDISISGANITLNAGVYKVSGYATYDFDNGGTNCGNSFTSRLLNVTTAGAVMQGSSPVVHPVSARVVMTLQSYIEGIITISTNATVLKFQRIQNPITGCNGTVGIWPTTTIDRILSQLMIEKIK